MEGMFPGIWLLVWIIAMLFPVSFHGFSRSPWRYALLGLIGLCFGCIFVLGGTIDIHMIWLLIGLKGLASTLEWILNWGEKRRYSILGTLGILFLIGLVIAGLWQAGIAADYNNAVHFNRMVTFMPEDSPLFNSTIPDNMLRLTTSELAENIILRNIATFGSNVQVLSLHVTIYQGRLVWVGTIGSSDLWTDNKIRGFVIVDANNPEAEPEIIKKEMYIGEGLIWFPPFHASEIQGAEYGSDAKYSYGRAYLTPDDKGEWKYVMTSQEVTQWSFVEQPHGIYVYDEFGKEAFYDMNEIPTWITQIYDEGWMERMVSDWGGHKRGEGFDLWAGGFPFFVNPSTDRVEISEDTRFIVDPDTGDIVALICVDPIGDQETLAGMFKFSRSGIRYYDLRSANIMGPHQAENVIESHILKPTTGDYEGEMPLLYTLDGTYCWYTPIYWLASQGESTSGHETVKLAGLGIVEANDMDNYAIVMCSEGFKGAKLVAEVERRFKGGAPITPTTEIVSGILEDKTTFIGNGNTRYILTVNGTDYLALTENLDFHTIKRIEDLTIGETITFEVSTEDIFISFS